MIWVNNRTFPHRQIDVASADIAAVLLLTPSPTLAIASMETVSILFLWETSTATTNCGEEMRWQCGAARGKRNRLCSSWQTGA
ncbi:hypothetical protein N7494_006974 [Penicillium frequentans]|uniref:Uncharacterized protein n=1 Tax=Penicillium frequentans TaxID=3151616 RepID=A0AAD6CSB8_9EURO|nr:hypothetical protein N7494_006974 [Penicillium glabrum]